MSTRIWTREQATQTSQTAFISQNLSKRDIQFLIGDDLGSDRLPIEIAIDAQPHRNTLTPSGINLTTLTEKCFNQPSRRH